MNSRYKTDFLTPSSSFLCGAGSVLNIGGDYFDYNNSSSDDEADKKAVSSDWKIVGADILSSMKQLLTNSNEINPQN